MKDEIKTATQYNYATLRDRTSWKTQLGLNIGLALPGVAVALLAANPYIQLAGGAWAALNLLPVLQWVIDV